MPLFGEEKDAVKANVLKLLKEKYDIKPEPNADLHCLRFSYKSDYFF